MDHSFHCSQKNTDLFKHPCFVHFFFTVGRSLTPPKGDLIQSKLLVSGAVNATINDQGCQHVTSRFESIRMFLSRQAGWPTFVQPHPSVKTVE